MTIYFYSEHDPLYPSFSNFAPYGFELDDLWWPTSEHFFQAQKYIGTPYYEAVRRCATPKEAAYLGRAHSLPHNWREVREAIMLRGVLRKFETHVDIQAILLATGDQRIVENAPRDYHWGCGADGTGKNRFGEVLMQVRSLLRARQQHQV
jgi:N-glycosidase YbiA